MVVFQQTNKPFRPSIDHASQQDGPRHPAPHLHQAHRHRAPMTFLPIVGGLRSDGSRTQDVGSNAGDPLEEGVPPPTIASGAPPPIAAAQVRTRYWLDNQRSLSVLRWCR